MSYSCVSCGCDCTTPSATSQCPACCSDGGEENSFIIYGKYVSVRDACKVNRILTNKEYSLLSCDGNQVSLRDGSQSSLIPLGNLRVVQGLTSVIGLNGIDLAQIKPSVNDKQVLYYEAGSIKFGNLSFAPYFAQSGVLQDNTDVHYAFLADDGSGNYILRRFRCSISAGEKKFIYMDSNHNVGCLDAWDLSHDSSECVIYFWNKTTEQVERLGPPTLGAGEVYSDYSLKLNNATGCPEWVKVVSLVTAVVGRWTAPSGLTTTSASDVQHNLSKTYDGGTPARFGGAGTITVTSTTQVQVTAQTRVDPASASLKDAGLYWALNGVEIPNTYASVFCAPNSAASQSVPIWAGELMAGDQLALKFRSEGSSAECGAVSVTAISM
jgi:hypothetical protein